MGGSLGGVSNGRCGRVDVAWRAHELLYIYPREEDLVPHGSQEGFILRLFAPFSVRRGPVALVGLQQELRERCALDYCGMGVAAAYGVEYSPMLAGWIDPVGVYISGLGVWGAGVWWGWRGGAVAVFDTGIWKLR